MGDNGNYLIVCRGNYGNNEDIRAKEWLEGRRNQ